jgi:hypothetical protein
VGLVAVVLRNLDETRAGRDEALRWMEQKVNFLESWHEHGLMRITRKDTRLGLTRRVRRPLGMPAANELRNPTSQEVTSGLVDIEIEYIHHT